MGIQPSLAEQFIDEKVYPGLRERFLPTRVYDKAEDYINTVNRLIDADTRGATLASLGVDASIKLMGKAFGRSIDGHPYLAIHKAHMQALFSAIEANTTARNALDSLNKAAESAYKAQEIESMATVLGGKIPALRARFGFRAGYQASGEHLVRTFAEVARPGPAGPGMYGAAASAGRHFAGAAAVLGELTASGSDYAGWRRDVCAAYVEALQLLAMVRREWQVAKRGGDEFTKKIQAMRSSSSPISRVAGGAADLERQYQALERHRSGQAHEAVMDPGRFAAHRVATVKAVAKRLGKLCDIAKSGLDADAKARLMATL